MRAREEERYVRFVAERHAGLYRTAFLLTGNHHTAQDAVQSTLVKVYLSWKRVRRADRPVAYVQRMLANEVASMHRRRSAGEVPTERPQDLPGARDQAGPEERLVEAQTVWQALETLSERQRAVVVLRYYADLSEAEIADTLGIAPGTVKAHAHAALAALGTTLRATDPFAQTRVEEAT
ncbi:SigE family RNA polymerase sigma factor [Fodinibacter luteus]|uniref:SigE family RNA polymerase sigma factor n=1 Tax=Fodinibacter luteus TaxID=552064 RepID=A0ABP8K0G5_9MICO